MKKIAFSSAFTLLLMIACNKVQTQKEGGESQDVRMYEESKSGIGSTTGDGKNGIENTGEEPMGAETDYSSSTSGSTAGSVGGSSYGSTSGMTGGGTTSATTGFTTSQTVSTTGTTGGGLTSGHYKTTDEVGVRLDNPDFDSTQSNASAASRAKSPNNSGKKIVPADAAPEK